MMSIFQVLLLKIYPRLPKILIIMTWYSSDDKESSYNAGDLGSIPGSGRSPGEGNGNPLQYSCLENPMEEEPGGLHPMGLQRVRHN